MKRAIAAATLLTAALTSPAAVLGQTALEEFDWNTLGPVGTQSWTNSANWAAPTAPPGNTMYPDDPNHVNVDEETIGPVVGANLSVGLTSNLDVSLGGDITITSLKLGVDNFDTNISGIGRLLLQHGEPSIVNQIPDPDPDAEPGDMVDEVTCSFNCGNALVESLGVGSGVNTISAVVGSTRTIDFTGVRTLNLTGGFEEVPSNTGDDTTANRTNLRSHIGRYDFSMPTSSQTRLLISGPVSTVVDNVLNPDEQPEDVPLYLNAGGSGTPAILSAENTESGSGFPHGIIDLEGGITGSGRVRIGTESRDNAAVPLSTVVLHDNSYTGRTTIDRANVVLKHNNAFGAFTPETDPGVEDTTFEVVAGNPANEVGFNLLVEPGAGETEATVDRVIGQDFQVPHDFGVRGKHSLTLTGDQYATNSGSWVNNLEEGAELTLSGRQYVEFGNIFTWDGSGLTQVEGQLRNADLDSTDTAALARAQFRKRGSGAVYVRSTQFGHTNTIKSQTGELLEPVFRVEGGNLHFSSTADLGGPNNQVESTGGAVGVDTGTVAAINGPAGNFANRFSNFAQRTDYGFLYPAAEVPGFDEYDNGGLMLTTAADAAANINFTTGNMARFQDMTLAAPEGGMTFTGTITPANNTYRLGGGSGTLTIDASKLTAAGNLMIANGGDYRNPNGEDRERLGMVKVTGTNTNALTTTVIGRYQRTLQDQVAAEDVGLAEELQYHGTTLAVESLADGASSIGSLTSAASLLVQGSTLRYEGAAGSTSRLFTVGTAGATLDASGTGAINFTNTGALGIDVAQSRGGRVDEFEDRSGILGGDLYNLGDTSDLVVGMTLSDSNGNIPDGTTITQILSPTRVAMSAAAENFLFFADTTVSFGEVDRTLTLTGDNADDNRLAAQIGDSANGGVVGLEKTGVGKWIVSNAANSYSGDTIVEDGTLSLEAAFLADSADVLLFENGTLDLNFAGSDDINSLYFNNLPLSTGTWGSLASTADNKRDWFTGLGILNVGMVGEIDDLAGDFNRDGVVNAADYTVWRDNDGAANEDALNGNGDGVGGIDADDLALWKSNYGATLASTSLGSEAVPEPSVVVLMLAAAPLALRGRRR